MPPSCGLVVWTNTKTLPGDIIKFTFENLLFARREVGRLGDYKGTPDFIILRVKSLVPQKIGDNELGSKSFLKDVKNVFW